jgi:type II secretory ATPase GspE/PulE/Tfp pilus assembly ATPase PilB-like protein
LESPLSDEELRRRSAAALFLKVHDLTVDDAAAAQRPVPRLCDLMISEALLTNSDRLRVCAATAQGAPVQFQRDGHWVDVMRFPAGVQVPVINRLKVMANLDVAKHPVQEGMLKVRFQGEELSVGITVRLQEESEEAILDLLPRTGRVAQR